MIKQFWIVVTNFSDQTVYLQNVVAMVPAQSENFVQGQLSHANLFGFIFDNKDKKFRKQHTRVYDIKTIRNQLVGHLEQPNQKYEKTVTAE